jgi:carbon monoxide dehydrogenase subunit G
MPKRKVSSAASTRVNARQNDVFEFLLDPRSTRRWNETVEYVSHRPEGAIRAGTVILCRIRFLGGSIQLPYRVVELDEPNSFSGEGSSGTFNYASCIRLITPTHEKCTDVTWSVTIEYPAILPFGSSYVTSRLSSELKRNLGNLRRIFI